MVDDKLVKRGELILLLKAGLEPQRGAQENERGQGGATLQIHRQHRLNPRLAPDLPQAPLTGNSRSSPKPSSDSRVPD